jgi:hypothetical protein
MYQHFDLAAAKKSITTPERDGMMNPLKGGYFNNYFHRKDAEHAEDLVLFFAFR